MLSQLFSATWWARKENAPSFLVSAWAIHSQYGNHGMNQLTAFKNSSVITVVSAMDENKIVGNSVDISQDPARVMPIFSYPDSTQFETFLFFSHLHRVPTL